MRQLLVALLATMLMVGETAHAAATLYTAPLDSPPPGLLFFICRAVNVSSKPVDMTVEIVAGRTGTSLISVPCTAQPGGGAIDCSAGATTSEGTAYCKVVVRGSKKSVRATLTATQSDGNPGATSEAR